MNKVCLNVSGINNKQMKTSLKNAIDKLEGVQNVDIDKMLGTVSVGYNSPADENEIKNCITQTGFSLS